MMKKSVYLKELAKAYAEGKISDEAYDAALMNINEFCYGDDEDEQGEQIEADNNIVQDNILEQLADIEMELFYAKNKDPENKKIATAWQSARKALEDYAKAIGLK